jgi:hypothetical protein
VTGIALARVITFRDVGSLNKYPLYNNFIGVYLAIWEVNMGLATACIPALTQLVRRVRREKKFISPAALAVEGSPAEQNNDASPGRSPPKNKALGKKKRSTLTRNVYVLDSSLGRTRPQDTGKGKSQEHTVEEKGFSGSSADWGFTSDQARWAQEVALETDNRTYRGRYFDD